MFNSAAVSMDPVIIEYKDIHLGYAVVLLDYTNIRDKPEGR